MRIVDLSSVANLIAARLCAAPCACTAAAIGHGHGFLYGVGAAGRLWFADSAPNGHATPPPATTSTIFDLASLTKPLTALTMARLERNGKLKRGEALGAILPELGRTQSGNISLELLAAHRSGLDGHRPLYAPLLAGNHVDLASALVTAANARRDDCRGEAPEEGFPPVYSDLGYLLLGAALERQSGQHLDDLVHQEITKPLGLSIASAHNFRQYDNTFDNKVAPTEDVAFRGGVIRGVVHDENAWALYGDRAAGHAGLFGDALSVVKLGVALLQALSGRDKTWLSAAEIEPLIRPRSGGSLLMGFDQKSNVSSSAGTRFGPKTFGHLGFTGTSLWIDPETELVGVVLTNRVHPTRTSDMIRKARPLAYDSIAEVMMGSRSRQT